MKKRILSLLILLTAAFAIMPFDAAVCASPADCGTYKAVKNTQTKTKAKYSVKVKDLKSGKDSCSGDIVLSGSDMSEIASWELTFETNFKITKITGARLSSRDDMKYTLVNNATPSPGKSQSIKIHIEGKKVTKPQIKKLSFKASEKDSAGDKKSNTAKKPKAKTTKSSDNRGGKVHRIHRMSRTTIRIPTATGCLMRWRIISALIRTKQIMTMTVFPTSMNIRILLSLIH